MQRYLWPALIALVLLLVLWVAFAIIGATRDPRTPPPSPRPETEAENRHTPDEQAATAWQLTSPPNIAHIS